MAAAATKPRALAVTTNPDLRSNALVTTDNATLAADRQRRQAFPHPLRRVRYIGEGTGSAWLGDRKIEPRPGLLLVMPRGIAHAGVPATSGRFKAPATKIPLQVATGTTSVNRLTDRRSRSAADYLAADAIPGNTTFGLPEK